MKRRRAGMLLGTLVICGGGLYFLASAAHELALSRANVPTECTIVSSIVVRHAGDDSDSHSARVAFFHEVDGRRYHTSEDGPHQQNTVEGRVKAEAQARGFSPGQVVRCARVAWLPRLATVVEHDAMNALPAAFFGAGLLLLPIAIEIVGRRRARN